MGRVPRSASSSPAPSAAPFPARRGRRRRLTAGFAVLAALAGYVTLQAVTAGRGALCTVTSADGGAYELTPEQASNAATISAVGTGRGLPERAVTIALATAMQESGLRNIRHGDRDSQGLFQQRPSQGWGTVAQITDPVYAAGRFYERLAEIPGYSRLPLTVAAQRVQRSGFPQAYAKHEPDAALLAASLTGRAPASLACGAQRGKRGAGDAAKVRAELARAFGPDAGQKPGRGAAGPPDEIAVPVPAAASAAAAPTGGPSGGPGVRRGWELAHWAVARADSLRIAEVSYAGRVWRADEDGAGGTGWSAAPDGAPARGGDVRIRLVQK
ncbi:hypothetical protein [Streptomyces sp. NPDC050504]|uniref:hypothetical protein n=1 Tax=Streptomyces sp. NPDC050504 TaxID=3365618 RepID=UPI0037BB01BB